MEISSTSVVLNDFISISLKQSQIENSNQTNDVFFINFNDSKEQSMLIFKNYHGYVDQNNLHLTIANDEIKIIL